MHVDAMRIFVYSKEMQKSYAKLMKSRRHVAEAQAVAVAVDKLRRHSCRDVICSLCNNDQQTKFETTNVNDSDFITEVNLLKMGLSAHIKKT